jgi:hypothetical protein
LITTTRREVVGWKSREELRRAFLPLEIYPISAGVKGGLAGSVAMAVLAMLYGLVSQHSIWYPINLLAAGFLPASMTETTAQLAAFQSERLSDRHSDSPDHVAAGRVALRRDAADASAAAGSAGRLHRAADVDRADSQHSRNRESGAQPAHSLALVCGSQVAIWDCRGHRRFPHRNAYARGSACRSLSARAWKRRE